MLTSLKVTVAGEFSMMLEGFLTSGKKARKERLVKLLSGMSE